MMFYGNQTRLVAGLGIAAIGVTVVATPAAAQRRQDYTPSQFISVLNGLGYPVTLTDSLESANVKQAIRDFQLQFQLPITGTMTEASQNTAALVVRTLQRNLNQSLNPSPRLPESQYYGSQTEALVKTFQDQNRLPITGIATLETRQKLSQNLAETRAQSTTTQPVITQPATATTSANPTRLLGPAAMPKISTPAPAIPKISSPKPTLPVLAPTRSNPPVANQTAKFGSYYTEPEFRQILQGLGYDIPPQRFLSDPSAIAAIQFFQQRYGLAPTGVADEPTQTTVKTIMRVLQGNLRLVENPNLTVTEFYDGRTETSVRAFQERQKMRVDGIATVSVRERLDAQAKQRLSKNSARN